MNHERDESQHSRTIMGKSLNSFDVSKVTFQRNLFFFPERKLISYTKIPWKSDFTTRNIVSVTTSNKGWYNIIMFLLNVRIYNIKE